MSWVRSWLEVFNLARSLIPSITRYKCSLKCEMQEEKCFASKTSQLMLCCVRRGDIYRLSGHLLIKLTTQPHRDRRECAYEYDVKGKSLMLFCVQFKFQILARVYCMLLCILFETWRMKVIKSFQLILRNFSILVTVRSLARPYLRPYNWNIFSIWMLMSRKLINSRNFWL